MKGISRVFLISVLGLIGCAAKPPTSAVSVLVWNPWNNVANPGEPISASGNTGFTLQPYPGSSLSSVVLWLIVNFSGNYTFGLTAVDSSSAHSIGTSSSGSVSLPNDSYYHPVTFTFSGNPAVSKGDLISFTVSAPSVPNGSASGSFCTQGSSASNVNIVLTSGGNPQSTAVAVVVNGGS